MDNLQLQEEVRSLQKLREHYADNLRAFGLELCDLPEDTSSLLDDCVQLLLATNLHELKETYIEEYYYTKKKELIENNLIIGKLQAEIDKLDEQLDREQKECDTLEKFIKTTKESNCSEAEMEHTKIMLETKIQALQDKQKSLKSSPRDLNIEDLVRKVNLLETNRKQKEKQ